MTFRDFFFLLVLLEKSPTLLGQAIFIFYMVFTSAASWRMR